MRKKTGGASSNGKVEPSAREVLAQIWSEVLGIEKIGIDANFFELGGSSVQAMQIVSRIRRSLGLQLTLRAFFDMPTVGGLTQAIVDKLGEETRSSEIPPPPQDPAGTSDVKSRDPRAKLGTVKISKRG